MFRVASLRPARWPGHWQAEAAARVTAVLVVVALVAVQQTGADVSPRAQELPCSLAVAGVRVNGSAEARGVSMAVDEAVGGVPLRVSWTLESGSRAHHWHGHVQVAAQVRVVLDAEGCGGRTRVGDSGGEDGGGLGGTVLWDSGVLRTGAQSTDAVLPAPGSVDRNVWEDSVLGGGCPPRGQRPLGGEEIASADAYPHGLLLAVSVRAWSGGAGCGGEVASAWSKPVLLTVGPPEASQPAAPGGLADDRDRMDRANVTASARWIRAPVNASSETGNAIRTEATLRDNAGRVQRAVLSVCGLGQHDVLINGVSLEAVPALAPSWSNYNRTCYYETHDVTAHLAALPLGSRFAIAVLLGNGTWPVGRARHPYVPPCLPVAQALYRSRLLWFVLKIAPVCAL